MKRRPVLIAALVMVQLAAPSVVFANGGSRGGGSSYGISKEEVITRIQNAAQCLCNWKTLLRADGTSFTGIIPCIMYAANGGRFGTAADPI